MIDPVEFGKQMGALVREALAPLQKRIEALEQAARLDSALAEAVQEVADEVRALQERAPEPGPKGDPGDPGEKGDPGDPGKDGAGVADLLIDRDGCLVVTLTDGRMKSLGQVVGRDGRDGLSMTDVTFEYDPGAHEIVQRWTVAGEAKELRYSAGGIRPGGFWREGMKCRAGQAITHDGALWIAKRDTAAKPCLENKDDWQLAARKGRDGRDGKDGKPPPGPVKLGGGSDA